MNKPENLGSQSGQEIGEGDFGELKISEIISRIQYKRESSSALEIDNLASKDFFHLLDACAMDGRAVIGVIRCWEKSEEELKDLFNRIERLKVVMPEIKGIILSINDEADANRAMVARIREVIRKNPYNFFVVPERIHHYSWTAGLNGPCALLYQGLQQKNISPENIFVLNLSFDVEFDEEEFQRLARKISGK